MKARTFLFTGLIALFGIAILLAACVANVGAPAPNEKVASLTFRADNSAALFAESCKKPYDCRLPNERLCETLVVEVVGIALWPSAGMMLKCTAHKTGSANSSIAMLSR